MSYDERVAQRIRAVLHKREDVSEKRMFGGLTFLVAGHMTVGIVKDELMVRVGPEAYYGALRKPHARAMDFTGRPMRGFLFVAPAGFKSDADLERWVGLGLACVASLPPKPPRGKRRPPNTSKAPSRQD